MTTLPAVAIVNGYHEDSGLASSPVFKSAGDNDQDRPHQLTQAEGGAKHVHSLLGKNGFVRGHGESVVGSLENYAGAARRCCLGTLRN